MKKFITIIFIIFYGTYSRCQDFNQFVNLYPHFLLPFYMTDYEGCPYESTDLKKPWERIIDEKLSVRETEKLVRSILNNKDNSGKKKASLDDVGIYREYEEKLRTVLGAKVQIQRKDNNKGKIVIEYNSSDEFEKLCDIIKR